ncbi:hypothetical protein, partial [Bartonella saheliensis]|uniref:hypothetical protein n=1 Tax=Bartonella saheliensis TaxID=1457016 RepID=UPI001409BFFC
FGGKDKTATALHNIADGNIASGSKDAITGGQINTISQDVAKFLGGGVAFNNGAFTQPTYKLSNVDADGKITDNTFNDVGSAFTGLDENIKNVNNRIKEVSEGVAQDSLNWNEKEKAFVAQHGKEKTNSKIKFLAAGDITKDSTEAINGFQLYSLGDKVAAYFGGGAKYENGQWVDPSFKVKTVNADGNTEDQTYKNVAEALTGVGTSFTNIKDEITNQINHLQSDDSAVVHYDKKESGETDYTSVTLGKGKDYKPVGLHNVADGIISDKSHDAINGGQIYKIGEDIAKFLGGGVAFNNGAFTQPTYKLSNVDADGKITDNTFNDVGSAFTGLDENIKNVNNRIKEVSEGVAQDSLNWNEKEKAFVAEHGKEKTNSKIKFLAAGDITKDSTEAINGSQLYSLNQTVAQYFGGGAKYEEGKWQAPSFTLKSFKDGKEDGTKTYHNVADAFSDIDSNFTNVVNNFTDQVTNITQEVQGDALLWDQKSKAFVAQHGEKEGKKENSKITSLANGEISKVSTDAVTGSQLYSLQDQFAKYLGGGAGYDMQGNWTSPTFKVKKFDDSGKVTEQEYKTVAEAFDGVNQSFTNIHNEVNEQINQIVGDSLVKQDKESRIISVGGEKSGTQVNFANVDKAARTLLGVKDGALSAKSTEAVNGSQLYSMSNTLASYFGDGAGYNEKGEWQAPSFKVNTVKENGKSEEKEYKNVAAALTGVGTSFTNIKNEITNQINHLQSDDSAVVHYDKKGEGETDYTSVTFGKGKDSTPVGLHNIANGQIAANSRDVVTGGQINTIGESIAKFLGGEAAFKEGGLTQPAYKLSEVSTEGHVKDKSYNDIGSAFVGLDENIKNVNNRIKEVSEGVAQDSLNWNEKEKAFVALHGEGKDSKNSKLKFLENGDITANSTEAVTGNQLYSLGDKVATYFGGGAKYENGQWVDPSFKVKTVNTDGNTEDQTYQNVAAAFEGVGTSFTNIKNEITNQINHLQSDDSAVVHYDKKGEGETNYTSVTFGKGKDSTPVGLHNIADGNIASGSKDAITGGQINTLSQDVAKFLGGNTSFENGIFTGPTYKLSEVDTHGQVNSTEFKDVGSAFAGLDENIKNVNNRIKEVSEGVAQDSLNWNEKEKAFVAQHGEGAKTNSKIKFLAAGDITKDSTEAINGSQLYSMNNTLATYFGGGAGYDAQGNWQAPSFKVKTVKKDSNEVEEIAYNNVADAFAGMSTSITDIHNEVNNQITNIVRDSLVKQDDTGLIKIGAEKEGSAINIANKNGEDRTLSGVKEATKDNEAVNKAQLDTNINEVNNNLTNKFNELTENITNVTQHIQGDALLWSKEDKAFSAQHGEGDEKTDRKITHLKAGDITMDSTDAVTGSQLYSLQDQFAKYLGGGAGYDEKGKWTAPTFKVKKFDNNGKETEAEYKTVAEAFDGVNQSFTNIHNEVNEQINQVVGDSLVKQNEKTHVISVGGETNGTKVNFANSDGIERVLSGVKAGDLSAKSTEAVNGSQLYSMSNTLARYFGGGAGYDEKGEWQAPSFKVNTVNADGKEKDESYQNVAEALAGVGTSFTNVHNTITNEINNAITKVEGDSLVKQAKETDPITIGKEVAGTEVNIANKDSKDRTLSGVKAAVNGNEAVNKAQLDQSLEKLSNSLQSDDSAVVHYDKKESGETDYTNVTFGKGQKAAAVALHNVADGQISKGSHDVVTGGQINTISQDVAKFLGGDTSFENGVFTGLSYKLSEVDTHGQVNSTEFKDVGSAFAGLDKNIKNVNDRIKEVSEGVAQDSLSWSKEDKAFSAQHGEGKDRTSSKITHILDGDITTNSSDAVNGSQLYSINNTLASYFGGGAEYKEGKWTAPNFKVNVVNANGDKVEEQSYKTVAEAFTGVGSSFTNLHNEVTNAVTDINNHINNVVSDSLVKQDEESKVIKIGAEKGGTSINISNSGAAARTLTGVKSGALTETSADAVNGSQLYSMNNTLASYFGGGAEYKEGKWTAPNFKVNVVNASGDKVEEQSYDNVAKAFAGVGTSFTNLHNEVTNAVTDINNHINNMVSDSLVKQDEKTHVIAVGGEKSGTKVTFANTDGVSRTLTGVKAGALTETSTDAVNGSQLFATNQNVTTVTNDLKTVSENASKFLGGGADILKGIAPTYTVQDKSYQSVADAFVGVDRSFTELHEEIAKNTSDLSDTIKQNALLWSDKDHAFVAIHGTDADKKNSKITSLANGSITEDSTDAINGSQLYSLNQTLASYFGGGAKFKNGQWSAPSFKVSQFSDDGTSFEEAYNTVSDAFGGVNSSFKGIHNEMTNAVTDINNKINQVVSDSLVKQAKETDPITIGKEVAGTEVNIANKDSKDRTLSGVKAATKDNEAVNKAQLDQSLEKLSNSLQSDDSAVVHYDKKESGDTDYTNVTFGKGKDSTPVGLHNVADGQIVANSHDVVTGGQINTLSQDVAKFLGGDTSFENGVFTGPTYKLSEVDTHGQVKDKSYNDVGSAFAGLDKNIKNVNDHLTNVVQDFTQQITDITQEVKGDALLWDETKGAFVAEHGKEGAKTNSKITSLANGAINSSSSDAVAGNQLHALGSSIAKSLGGEASYEDGKWIAPSFKVNTVSADGSKVEEQSYDNVAKAFASVGSSFSNLHKELKNEINQVVGDSLVKQDEKTHIIAVGGEKSGTEVTFANTDGASRTLTGVKAGALTETSADAVNGSQLYSMNNTLASYFGGGAKYENGQWTAPNFKVNVVNASGDKVEEQSYKTVAEAFAGVGSSFTSLHKELKNEINQVVGDSLVKQDEKTHVIAVGGEKSGTEVTFANTDGASRTLTGVKAGALTETSADAVNGSQLFATNQNVTTVTNDLKTVSENTSKFLGGGADILKGIAPTYTVQDKSYQSVADAFVGVDRSFTELHEEIAKNTSDLSDTIKQNALLWSDKDHAFVAIHGPDADKKNSKITSLANGSITEDSTDAINGSQLYSLNQTLASYFGGGAKFENGQWVAPSFTILSFNEDGSSEETSYNSVSAA